MGKSKGAIIIAPFGLFAALVVFAAYIPPETYFWVPTAVYVTTVAIAIVTWGRITSDASQLGICLLFSLVFLLGSQYLIAAQGIPTRWLGWGRFPLGDAGDFLQNALTVLVAGEFLSIRGRPLSNAFVAGIWHAVHFDLVLLGTVLTLFCGAALFLFGRIVLSLFGIAAGGFALAITVDFVHEHIGAASTEPMGFFLGLAAACLLLVGAQSRSPGLFGLGVFALTVTFLYRVGAVFVIPFLLLWPFLAPVPNKERWRCVAFCVIGIVAASVLHTGVSRAITPDSPSFVNAPKSWYAIIAMGDAFRGIRPKDSVRDEARWVQIFDDHPGLSDLPIDRQGARFVEIVIEAVRARPLSAIIGAGLEYADQLGRAGLFRFVDNKPFRFLVFILFLAGLAHAVFRARRDPIATLLALAGVGQLLSIPFLHGGENRVHIGMAGIMAATAAYGLQFAISAIPRLGRNKGDAYPAEARNRSEHTNLQRVGLWALILPVLTLGISLGTVAVTAGNFTFEEPSAQTCSPGEKAIHTQLASGSAVSIGADRLAPFGLHFKDWTAFQTAIEGWETIQRKSGLIFYAPIDTAGLRAGFQKYSDIGRPQIRAYIPNATHGLARLASFPADTGTGRVAACVTLSP